MKTLLLHIYHTIRFLIYWVKFTRMRLNCTTPLSKVLEDSKLLIITHSNGGGTEQFIQNDLKKKENVVILRNLWYWKDIAYVIENPAKKLSCIISYKELKIVFNKSYEEIIVNSLISFSKINYLFSLITNSKKSYISMRVSYLVHDYHSVCPKYNLISKNWFCNLECNKNNCVFDSFYEGTRNSVGTWRKMWDSFFQSVDDIIVFSSSTKSIFLEIYPQYEKKISVIPHDMTWCTFTKIERVPHSDINIAFVGRCTTIPKGKLIIREFCKMIKPTYKIHMIGSKKDIMINKKNVFWYGKYEHENLQKILTALQIDVVIFPSVCPETFSYLTSELIQMNIPIISFDFGAQGEKVSNYINGKTIKKEDIKNINEIIDSLLII